VCVVLCAVFRLIVVLFCVMCVICVLCLIVVPLPLGENPFAVKINNNNILGTDSVAKENNNRINNTVLWVVKPRSSKRDRRFEKI
jgi:hypothetical protein